MYKESLNQLQRKNRTKDKLVNAIKKIILRKNFDQITVNDIISEAKLGRGTFYFHFDSIEEIVWELMDRIMIKDIKAYLNKNPRQDEKTKYEKWEFIFEKIEENQKILRILLGINSHISIYKKTEELIQTLSLTELKSGFSKPKNNIPIEVISKFFTGSLMGLIIYWLENPKEIDSKQIGKYFFELKQNLFISQ